jgi:acetyl-CoA/propionyl-CoA carboxylase biotin carboxyl carrier protein
MPTVIPFHASVVADPAFAPAEGPFSVHTRWIETEYDNQLQPYAGTPGEAPEATPREAITVEVGGRRLEVVLPAGFAAASPAAAGPAKKARKVGGGKAAAATGDSLTSPMQGTIVKVAVEEGARVAAGDLIVVLEAMKMEQPLNAHKAGTITGLTAEVGATVTSGSVLCEIKD